VCVGVWHSSRIKATTPIHIYSIAHHKTEHKPTPTPTTQTQGMKVVGFHFVGPNAGEITQGFSLALKVRPFLASSLLFSLLFLVCLFGRLSVCLFGWLFVCLIVCL
jgi:hypothetical protein